MPPESPAVVVYMAKADKVREALSQTPPDAALAEERLGAMYREVVQFMASSTVKDDWSRLRALARVILEADSGKSE